MAAIQTNGLTKYYGDVRGIEDLSFDVREGEVFGFLGPNGAGKTTTIRTLMGFQSPTEGSATVLGADIADASALREARSRIGFLPSEPGFNENVTGRRLLEYHGSLRGDVRSDELLELFDPPLDRRVGDYSRGNKQMLAIVLAFMNDPDLMIMDEPTSGLDPLKQDQFLEFIRAEQERGKTFFFSSHILGEVRKVCDRIGIIRNGHLVELEDIESLLDRTGKVVRANLGDSVTANEFAIEGAHDVTVSGESVGPATAETDGGEDSKTVSFTYTGTYEPLLRRLLNYDVLDLTIEEAPLEDVFMRFYGDHNPEETVERVENERGDDRDGGGTDDRNTEAADV
ncbi:ABC transporter ATP-binding protein [Halococcus saccharolyticus]|uniref:ABC transporter n=1 Tax=Halococcus saccharolyticus DSM 5350 TaxID=1227455 RepID=M0MJG3_9EURY|nr:ABC transporter ATP-binding protein [Halococcus saccharolyticus]EMA45847.1 ABC transporter [Halococcus saccharolyticus DSM 5350]